MGRPPLDQAVKIQRQLWCREVERCAREEGITCYRMDYLFDIHYDQRKSKNSYDKRRRKIFEDLRKRNLLPFGKDSHIFLTRVFQYQNSDGVKVFEPTRHIYESFIWEFFQTRTMTLDEIRAFKVKILMRYDGFSTNYSSDNAKIKIAFPLTEEEKKLLFTRSCDDMIDDELKLNLMIPLRFVTCPFDRLALIGLTLREKDILSERLEAIHLEGVYQNQLDVILKILRPYSDLKDQFMVMGIARMAGEFKQATITLEDLITNEAIASGKKLDEIDCFAGQNAIWMDDSYEGVFGSTDDMDEDDWDEDDCEED